VVVDTTKKKEEVIAEVDFTGAHTTLYEGAVYLCESELFTVEKLDYPNRRAYVKKTEGDYYTMPLTIPMSRSWKVLREIRERGSSSSMAK